MFFALIEKGERKMSEAKINRCAKILELGGVVATGFERMKGLIDRLNEKYSPLMRNLGLLQRSELDKYLNAITNGYDGILSYYLEASLEELKRDGKTSEIASARKKRKAEFKRMVKGIAPNGWESLDINSRDLSHLKIATPFLYLTPDGLRIRNVELIKHYESIAEAEKSETKKIHEEAAESINCFFNGTVITEEEFFRYFRIRNGRIEVEPSSVNVKSYARLGGRHIGVKTAEE